MTFYDALMILIVVVMFIQGAWRGMVWQIAPIVSLILGYMVAYPMSVSAAPYFGEPPLNRLWAMIAIYAAVSLAVYLLVRSVRESLERLKLVEFDRHLGALLGGVKGVLYTVVATVGLISISPQARDIILKSESSTIAGRIVNTIAPILPPAVNDLVKPYVKKFNDEVPEYAKEPLTFPEPPQVLTQKTPKVIARQDKLAKPKRFDDEQSPALTPLPNDDAPFDPPSDPPPRTTSRRPPAGNEPRKAPPLPTDDDFFNADPNQAFPPSRPPR